MSSGPDCLVIHYDEIGLKGKNRDYFEKKLIANIKKALGENANKVYRRYGRVIAEINEQGKKELERIKESLSLLPGISSFGLALRTILKIEEIKKKALGLLKGKEFESFKIDTKRSLKRFPMKSPEVNNVVGQFIVEKLNKKVDLKSPEKIIFIEICEKEGFVYDEKIKSIGGLPVGASGKVLCSLSGGLDSPVSGFLMMKRGCQVVFVHIHNKTQVKEAVKSKLDRLVKELTKVQLKSKFYLVPFEKIQQKIILTVPAKYRMIVYRRFMMRILNEIGKKERAKAIVTGDSVGQVASQTLENLNCIYEVTDWPILNPLSGLNKEEIINLARKIGTYELSTLPYPDCCSFMIPKSPELKAGLKEIKKVEENIENKKGLIEDAVKRTEIKVFEN